MKTFCTNCGYSLTGNDVSCPNCGAAPAYGAIPALKACPHCGNTMDSKYTFCGVCGNRLQ